MTTTLAASLGLSYPPLRSFQFGDVVKVSPTPATSSADRRRWLVLGRDFVKGVWVTLFIGTPPIIGQSEYSIIEWPDKMMAGFEVVTE